MGHRKNQAFLKRIAVRIKIVREKAGITQEQFYNDTGRYSEGNMSVLWYKFKRFFPGN
jgi:hypothetical protein